MGGDGVVRLEEQDLPAVGEGTVLVEVHASLVSPAASWAGWRGLSRRRRSPDRNIQPKPLGYANAGVVLEAGRGVDRFEPGDRVCCMGGGYACHTDYAVVPHHLCVHLPEKVTFAQGAYGHLAATGAPRPAPQRPGVRGVHRGRRPRPRRPADRPVSTAWPAVSRSAGTPSTCAWRSPAGPASTVVNTAAEDARRGHRRLHPWGGPRLRGDGLRRGTAPRRSSSCRPA